MTEKRIDKKDHRFRTVARATCKVKNCDGQASGIPMSSQAHTPYCLGNLGCLGECKADYIMPIREELSLSMDFYESLDEQAIDVTQERIDEARMLSVPFEHVRT